MNKFDKTNYIYTPLFCEENIWKFLESNTESPDIRFIDVLFIINPYNTIALFEQKMSDSHLPVIWDYHVIVSAKINNKTVIFDFDSRCSFPCDIDTYFTRTFDCYNDLQTCYRPLIRTIDADYFYKNFTSDRKHMLNVIPQTEFPNYDIITTTNNSNSLPLIICRSFNSVIQNSEIMTPIEYLNHLSDQHNTNLS